MRALPVPTPMAVSRPWQQTDVSPVHAVVELPVAQAHAKTAVRVLCDDRPGAPLRQSADFRLNPAALLQQRDGRGGSGVVCGAIGVPAASVETQLRSCLALIGAQAVPARPLARRSPSVHQHRSIPTQYTQCPRPAA